MAPALELSEADGTSGKTLLEREAQPEEKACVASTAEPASAYLASSVGPASTAGAEAEASIEGSKAPGTVLAGEEADGCAVWPGDAPRVWRTGRAASPVHVYCDLDGVLVDFVRGVEELTGHHPDDFRRWNNEEFMWTAVARDGGFFAKLPWMPDGWALWEFLSDEATRQRITVSVLTGAPAGRWAQPQKVRWVKEQLGRWVWTDVCWSRDKPKWAAPGLVLVDDNEGFREAWEAAGGIFIHHRSAAESVTALRRLLAPDTGPAKPRAESGRTQWSAPQWSAVGISAPALVPPDWSSVSGDRGSERPPATTGGRRRWI